MNNKIKKKLIKEFDKYDLDKNILRDYTFDVKNKKIVYLNDNKINKFIKFNNNSGVRLKRNDKGKFRLQIININSEPLNGQFIEQLGGTKPIIPSIDTLKRVWINIKNNYNDNNNDQFNGDNFIKFFNIINGKLETSGKLQTSKLETILKYETTSLEKKLEPIYVNFLP